MFYIVSLYFINMKTIGYGFQNMMKNIFNFLNDIQIYLDVRLMYYGVGCMNITHNYVRLTF
jgi:hypothetical protein